MSVRPPVERICFASYEVDLASNQLSRGGVAVKIQAQPLQVLCELLARPDEVISREDLTKTLWPSNTHVEFDANLNSIVKRLRQALDDDPRHPRYIETLPRVGYRFICPVRLIRAESPSSEGTSSAVDPASVAVAHSASQGVIDQGQRLRRLPQLVAAALLVSLGIWAYRTVRPDAQAAPTVRRWTVSSPEGAVRVGTPQISPDGKNILFSAEDAAGSRSLWLRQMDRLVPVRLASTDGVVGYFWGPDSLSIGFVSEAKLKAVAIDGGELRTLCSLPDPGRYAGGTWSPDGEQIVFSSGGSLYEVASEGGPPRVVIEPPEGTRAFYWLPHFLPSDDGSQSLLFVAETSAIDRTIVAANLKTGERRKIIPGMIPSYAPEGFLVYGERGGDLMALPFSLTTLEATGEAFAIGARYGASFSSNGILVQPSPRNIPTDLVWRDRSSGRVQKLAYQAQMGNPAISPDGTFASVEAWTEGSTDVWVIDLERGAKTQLTFTEGQELDTAWSPDGLTIAYGSFAEGEYPGRIQTKAADGSGEAQTLVKSATLVGEPEWSYDGRYLAYTEVFPIRRTKIRYIELHGASAPSEPLTFLDTTAHDYAPQFAPQGGYIAYVSDESGRDEVYLRSFPDGFNKQAVSTNGGSRPRWRPDGQELYYAENGRLMSVAVEGSAQSLRLGVPELLFYSPDLKSTGTGFAPSSDGRRFLTVHAVGGPMPPDPIRVVENWYEEFRPLQR